MASEMVNAVINAEKEAKEKELKARETAEKIVNDAKSEAESIVNKSKSEAESEAQKIFNKAEEKHAEQKSDARLKTRDETVQILFSAKKKQNEAVSAVIEHLKQS